MDKVDKELLKFRESKLYKRTEQGWAAAIRLSVGGMKNPARIASLSKETRKKAAATLSKQKKGKVFKHLLTKEIRAKAHASRKKNGNYKPEHMAHLQTEEVKIKRGKSISKSKKGIAPAHNFDRKFHEKKYREINQLSLDGKLIKTWKCIKVAADTLGINSPGITCVASNKPQYKYIKTYKGYKWEYKKQ